MLRRLADALRWKAHALRHDDLCHRHPLGYLFLELTRRCNLRCAYCGSSCSPEDLRREMPVERWIEIVRQVAEDFDPRRVMVAVMGGEPLLVEGVADLLDELDRLGFAFGVVTNGTLLDSEMARRIVASRMGSLSLSLDAPPPLSDELRGRGVTDKVERALENLRAAGYRGILEVLSTVTRPVIPELEAMQRWLRNLGVRAWRLCAVMPIGRAAKRPDLTLRGEDLRRLLDFLRQARARGGEPVPSYGCESYLGEEYEGRVRPYPFRCRAGVTIASVLADGSLSACPELGRGFVQGSIHEARLAEVWERGYQVFRDRRWAWRGDCRGCEVWDRCRGGSMHLYPEPGGELLRCTYQLLRQERQE